MCSRAYFSTPIRRRKNVLCRNGIRSLCVLSSEKRTSFPPPSDDGWEEIRRGGGCEEKRQIKWRERKCNQIANKQNNWNKHIRCRSLARSLVQVQSLYEVEMEWVCWGREMIWCDVMVEEKNQGTQIANAKPESRKRWCHTKVIWGKRNYLILGCKKGSIHWTEWDLASCSWSTSEIGRIIRASVQSRHMVVHCNWDVSDAAKEIS